MAKEFIQKLLHKFIPDHDVIKQHKNLQFLGDKLHDPNLWHLNRRSASMAFVVGLFCAWIPTPGQMAIAAIAEQSTNTAAPGLIHAAHEFEAQMMKELLKPMTGNDALTGEEEVSGRGQAPTRLWVSSLPKRSGRL